MAEGAYDDYDQRDVLGLGPLKGTAQNYSIDASYTFSDAWQATAWVSRNDTRAEQQSAVSASAGAIWAARLRNEGNAFGLGFRGKPHGTLEIGADLSHSDINDQYRQQAITGAAIASLPDVGTRLTNLKLFSKYALQKNAGIRLDYIYDRFSTNDWTWTTWIYADGTRVTQSPVQKVSFVGVSVYYRWQ